MNEPIALKSMPFDSNEIYDEATGTTSYDRVAYSKDLAEWMRNYFSNGILVKGSTTISTELQVTHTGALNLSVAPGEVIINGRTGWVENATELTVDMGGSQDRIDRVVMELNVADRYIYLKLLKGTEAEEPEPPALTQTEDVFQIPLAQIKVNAESAVVAEVIDERAGYISNVTIGIEPPHADEAQAISVSDEVAEQYGLDEYTKDVDHALQNVPSVVPQYTTLLDVTTPEITRGSIVSFDLLHPTKDFDELIIITCLGNNASENGGDAQHNISFFNSSFSSEDANGYNFYYIPSALNTQKYSEYTYRRGIAITKIYKPYDENCDIHICRNAYSLTNPWNGIAECKRKFVFNDIGKLYIKATYNIQANGNIKILGVKYHEN